MIESWKCGDEVGLTLELLSPCTTMFRVLVTGLNHGAICFQHLTRKGVTTYRLQSSC